MASSLLRPSSLPPSLKTTTTSFFLHLFSSSSSPSNAQTTLTPSNLPPSSSTSNPQTTLTPPNLPFSPTTSNPQTTLTPPSSSPSTTSNTESTPLLKPSLPLLHPSNDAESISQILLHHHNPFHSMESSLQLNGISLSPPLVHQILLRIQHSSKIALAFFDYCLQLPNYTHDTTAFNILIDIVCKVRQFDVAWHLLVQMDQQYQKMKEESGEEGDFSSVKPNFTTFYILVKR